MVSVFSCPQVGDDLVTWMRERPSARLLMGWSHGIPELTALQDRIDEDWAQSMADALRARGIDLPSKQLYSVCCTFNETLDALAELTVSEGDEFSADVVYASKYTKDIEIVLGKMLKLVFPPDTPSVRGFDIEDTLIIVPQ